MKGSVAVRRAAGGAAPHLGPHLGHPLAHHHHHHFPPMAVDSLHHHHANNHNSHQHMARIKAGVARTTSSSSAASSSSVLSSSSAGGAKPHATASSASSSAGGTGGRAAAAERLGGTHAAQGPAGQAPSERLTPRRFLDKYSLPRVVRVVAETGGNAGGRPPMSGPLAQPLLLYRQYSSCKVLARSLRKDKHAAVETGPPLVIPDSYQGWFSLVRERSLQTRAKVYTTMQQLVNARVAVFLSKSSLAGFKLAHSTGADGEGAGLSGRRLQYARSTIRGGQVLRLLAVFEDNESGSASARARRGPGGPGGLGLGLHAGAASRGSALGRAGRALPLGRMGGAAAATQYAQCLTARNESVFVPVSTTGAFYAVATEDANDADRDDDAVDVDVDLSRVYQLPQLLRLTAEPLPVKVQLVCGPIQNPLPGGFNGLLVLEDLQQEDVILACTLPRSWALPSGPAGPAGLSAPSTTASATPSLSGDVNAIIPAAAASATATTSSSSSSSSPSPTDEGKPVFLEMDADSKFLLTRPLASREAEARFFKTPLLRRVLAHCRERADLWSSQIKVTHHVYPAVAADSAIPGAVALPGAAPAAGAGAAASIASGPAGPARGGGGGGGGGGSARPASEHGSSSRAIQGLFRVGARDKDSSALGGRASSVSSGGSKKSQSFRYASPAMMGGSTTSSSGAGGKPPSGTGANVPTATPGQAARGTQRGTHQLLQQLQSLPGLKNLLRRSNSTSPQGQEPPDVPLSVVFPELFGLPAADATADADAGAGAATTSGAEGDGGGGGSAPNPTVGPSITSIAVKPTNGGGIGMSSAPARQQQLRFYADDLPYGRVADAIPTKTPKPSPLPPVRPRPRPGGLLSRGRPYYDEAEDEDGEEDEDGRQLHNDDDENIYAEICECPRRGRGVIVSGARVILTTTCSEERRGYYTFASATSKDQYYTGGSDGTFSGTMSSSNPSNPEEDLYDNVC